MSAAATLLRTAQMNMRRHLRSPALWLTAIAAPVAAHILVPGEGAGYSVLTVNNSFPVLDSAMLGLQLGVIVATLMMPIAYIFLRAGPTRKRPTQVTDIAPHSRVALTLGRWIGDTAALWLLVGALIIAGWILALFRLPLTTINPFHIALGVGLVAAPALALTAAIRTAFDALPGLRSWPGDIAFFFVWIFILITSLISSTSTDGLMLFNPWYDPVGFVPPLVAASPDPIEFVAIGSSPVTSGAITLDALKGVLNPDFVLSRFIWLGLAACLAIIAGLVLQPQPRRSHVKTAGPRRFALRLQKAKPAIAASAPMPTPTTSSGARAFAGLVISELKLLVQGWLWPAAFMIALLAPYRSIAGTALILAIALPVITATARWQGRTMSALATTTGNPVHTRLAATILASFIAALTLHLPALARTTVLGGSEWISHMAIMCLAVPVIACTATVITRSGVTARLLFMAAAYAYLSSSGGF